jgi:cobalt-zinc-cadmium efflux system membrane fusion protein
MNSRRQKESPRPSLKQRLLLAGVTVAVIAVVALAIVRSSTRQAIDSLVAVGIDEVRSLIENAEAHSDKDHDPETKHDHEHAALGEGPAQSPEHEDGHPDSDDQDDHGATTEGEPHSEPELALSPERLRRLGIEVAVADGGPIALELERPAEVKFDSDRVVHIVPRVAGVVSQVEASQGQLVEKDQLLAVTQSRELAELKSTYLADLERLSLARENFERERRLWEKRISSEKDYLVEKAALAEATIAVTASAQKLRALGFSQHYIDRLRDSETTELTKYEIRAPIGGTVIERHLSLGEAVSTEKDVFMVAETSSVWVDITVYPEDLPSVSAGQTVRIDLGSGDALEGKIAFVTANVHEETRTAVARVVIDSAEGRL